jgi:uncharacterized protein YbjT (DUF2867 family)
VTSTASLVLVFGASSYIGSNLVPRLFDLGYRVRATARSPEVIEARGWKGVELARADALKPDTLHAALAGVRFAYYLVHSMAAGKDFGRVEVEAAENFARAAEAAGVERVVYLGGLIPPDANSEHLLSRRDTGEVLRRCRVPVTEIRAGIIVGPGSAAFEVMRDLVLHLPVMLTPRWVRAKSPPIALDNLLEYMTRMLALPETAGRIYDAAGPDTLTYEEMMREIARHAGKRPWIIPVPVLSPELSAYWLKFVTAVPTNVARALIGGLKHDFSADDAELRRLVPQRLLTFRESVEAALEAERQHAVPARWTEGAFVFRNYRMDYAYYAKRASGSALTSASPAAVWHVVSAIGGENRYFYGNILWKIREIADWMFGGVGLRYGRRHPSDLRVGDTVDSWRVIGVEPGLRLTLMFGMKAPGAGVLELGITHEADERTRITATAYWHPAGVWGLLYWYAMIPAHLFIFDGMTRAIAHRAEADMFPVAQRTGSPNR